MNPPRIRFKPVQLKARHDGWTPARQIRFIEVLAATKSITRACRLVGMSRESAYKLRDRPEARQFRRAWNAALRPEFDHGRRGSSASKLTQHCQSTSSALTTLQTYLAQLRGQEDALGSAPGE
jgi:molybdenum-dependent DNA-binding transcriptional regulator ModE